MWRMVVALAVVTATTASARGDGKVALLTLDATQQLEIYGQPVASEVARELGAAGIDVAVVGPKTAVPGDAALILDGTIAATAGKPDVVTLSLRVRDPQRDVDPVTVSADPVAVTAIDHAAAQLATRVVPAIKSQLEAIARVAGRTGAARDSSTAPAPAASAPAAAALSPLVVAVAAGPAPPLAAALTRALAPWVRRHQRDPLTATAASAPDAPFDLVHAVVAQHAPLGLALDIVGYEPVTNRYAAAPMARARIRVRLASATAILFDRVLVTDTVVGERGMAGDALADRVAGEVLAILGPHLLRVVPSWGR